MRNLNTKPKYDGAKIAARREEQGLTQEELGSRVGVSRHTIIRIEQGRSGALNSLTSVCDYLHLPVREVFAPALVSAA